MFKKYPFFIALVSIPFVSVQAEIVLSKETLNQTTPYSLYLSEDGATGQGYFPMGFIHGDIGVTIPMGYNLREDTTCFAGLALDEPFPALKLAYPTHWDLRYYSQAWPMNALKAATAWNLDKMPIHSMAYGDITASMDRDGKYVPGGDNFNPSVIRYLYDYVRRHVQSRLADPEFSKRIVFWGLDNEEEGHIEYSPFARKAFAIWLAEQYGGDITTLNRNWRTDYDTFQAAAEGPLPGQDDYESDPAASLDLYTFQTDHFVRLLVGLAKAMYERDPEHRGVVHKTTQQTIEMCVTSRIRTLDHGLFAELIRPYSGGLYGIDMYGAGDRQNYETSYAFNCIRPLDMQPGYGVMLCETNNHGGPDHQFAATMWRVLGNGVKAVDYFTTGGVGAVGHWDLFGFLDPATGKPRAKLLYAARWAQMVHRMEAFWKESIPAPDMPRVAILMPRRDVLLSGPSDRNEAVSIWSYPENHRWMVYRWLREQGYWVDVLPYTKLDESFLKQYQGLFLIGAEHLSAKEIATVDAYVRDGGVLIADALAGLYDEHHGVQHGMDEMLGVTINEATDEERGLEKIDESYRLIAKKVNVIPDDALVVTHDSEGQATSLLREYGKGRTLYLPFLLGTLAVAGEKWEAPTNAGKYLANGPTADGEDYLAYEDEFLIGEWLNDLLIAAGLEPSYDANKRKGILRVEQPLVDSKGNVAVVVGTRGLSQAEWLKGVSITLPLPEGPWTSALWSPSQDDSLQALPVQMAGDGLYTVELPDTNSAGVLYFLKDHAPVMSISRIETGARAADAQMALVKPGQTFQVDVTVINPGPKAWDSGTIETMVPEGWSISPQSVALKDLAVGEDRKMTFEVTANMDPKMIKPDRFHSMVFRINDGKEDIAILSTTVEGAPDLNDIPHLLTDNGGYPETFPYSTKTGASYKYAEDVKDDSSVKLTNGFGENGFRACAPWSHDFFATYETKTVGVVFDLKSVRKIDTVQIVLGPGPVWPTSWKVSLGADEGRFSELAQGATPVDEPEVTVRASGQMARYVKVDLVWPEAGGTLAEIEVWGE